MAAITMAKVNNATPLLNSDQHRCACLDLATKWVGVVGWVWLWPYHFKGACSGPEGSRLLTTITPLDPLECHMNSLHLEFMVVGGEGGKGGGEGERGRGGEGERGRGGPGKGGGEGERGGRKGEGRGKGEGERGRGGWGKGERGRGGWGKGGGEGGERGREGGEGGSYRERKLTLFVKISVVTI